MVIVWIGIAIGAIIAVTLIFKIKRTSRSYFSLKCERCGFKTNGLKCPICENEKKI